MNKQRKKKLTTILLCVFLGWLGIHKFYEGKVFMGILYLLTGGFGLVGVVIDLIILLVRPSRYY